MQSFSSSQSSHSLESPVKTKKYSLFDEASMLQRQISKIKDKKIPSLVRAISSPHGIDELPPIFTFDMMRKMSSGLIASTKPSQKYTNLSLQAENRSASMKLSNKDRATLSDINDLKAT